MGLATIYDLWSFPRATCSRARAVSTKKRLRPRKPIDRRSSRPARRANYLKFRPFYVFLQHLPQTVASAIKLLKECVAERLVGAAQKRFPAKLFPLDTLFSFGGGQKTPRPHRARARSAVRAGRFQASRSFVDFRNLSSPASRKVPGIAAFDGENADPAKRPCRIGGRQSRSTLSNWGRIAAQLAWQAGYELVRRPTRRVRPGPTRIAELYWQPPVLIVLDELEKYLRKVRHLERSSIS